MSTRLVQTTNIRTTSQVEKGGTNSYQRTKKPATALRQERKGRRDKHHSSSGDGGTYCPDSFIEMTHIPLEIESLGNASLEMENPKHFPLTQQPEGITFRSPNPVNDSDKHSRLDPKQEQISNSFGFVVERNWFPPQMWLQHEHSPMPHL